MADDHSRTLRAARLDTVRQEFEAACQRGERPTIEEFVERACESDRKALLAELLKLILDDRHKNLDAPTILPSAVSTGHLPCTVSFRPAGDVELPADDRANGGSTYHRRRTFGDYELIEFISRGGMGAVYKARQTRLNRIVAVKMMLSGQLADAEDVRRFHIEAEAAAGLDHQGIVPVFENGEVDGEHYFSMAYVEGQSLAAKLREGPLPPREAAELVRKVAEAVQYAHDKGIIHRDLKPGNILLDKDGEPRVSDFGLAKRVEVDSSLTVTGQAVGTPSFMAPEQAAGKAGEVGVTSDVYALGAVLYNALTGRPPFQAPSPAQTMVQVLEQEPAAPRLLNRALPRNLETICLKCLRKETANRYPSAQALADDLRRWLDGKPIRARRVTHAERAWLWCKRRPALASLAAALLVVLTVGTWVAVERQNAVHAAGLVQRLLDAPLESVPSIVAELPPYRRWCDPKLQQVFLPDGNGDEAQRLRAAIGLLAVDSSQSQRIYDALLAAPPDEASVLVGVLDGQKNEFIERLWNQLSDTAAGPRSRLRAAMALASYDARGISGTNARWDGAAPFIVDELLAEARQEPGQYQPLAAALAPLADFLIEPLSTVFRDGARNATERDLATSILARYALRKPKTLAELAVDADGGQFRKLYTVLPDQKDLNGRQVFDELVHTEPAAELSPAQRVRWGQRRAGAAIALLRQGERESIFDALRAADDPESRSQFIHRLRDRGVEPAELIECVECADGPRRTKTGADRRVEDGVLHVLLLALGEFELSALPADKRDRTLARLAEWYAHDPSSAIHGAAGWLLRHWQQDDAARKVDETPVPYSPGREWFTLKFEPKPVGQAFQPDASGGDGSDAPRTGKPDLSPIYVTFVVFPPGKYSLGSPEDEADHMPHERRHQVEITRPFAVSDREITWEQFNPFDASLGASHHDAWERQFGRTLMPAEPAFGLYWFEAVSYSRWLTTQAGMTESDQCYGNPVSLEKDAEGNPKDWPLDLAKKGLRLPTEAEWEIACRGGTISAYSFGNDPALLAHYGWFTDNSAKWSHAVGQLRPNPRGLFDFHGNLMEWCHDWYGEYAVDAADPVSAPTGYSRVVRGGSWFVGAALCRSAYRDFNQATRRGQAFGFRLALTCVEPK